MEKVTQENPRRFSRREVLRAALTAAAAVGVSQIIPPESQGLENTQGGEPVPPRRWMPSSLPTVGHDVIFISPETNLFIPAPPQEPTPTIKENIVAQAKPVVAEVKPLVVEEERNPQVASKESKPEYNLLSPEAFAPYAAFGGPETSNEEILDFFPESYHAAPDGVVGLWNRGVEAKQRNKPQTNATLAIELATEPKKITFGYLQVPGGTAILDLQEKKGRIMLLPTNVIIIGEMDQKNNFLALYQEPVNEDYYFGQVQFAKGDALIGGKNVVAGAFIEQLKELAQIGTEEARKRLYLVKERDSLSLIAAHFSLPSWHSVYAKNLDIVDKDPAKINPGLKFQIPDRFKEAEFIKDFTVGTHTLPQTEEFFGPTEDGQFQYFPETEHFVREPFLSLVKDLGIGVLGYPISEALPGNSFQHFRNFIVEWRRDVSSSDISGESEPDGVNPCFFLYPYEWETHLDQTYPFEQIYNNHGATDSVDHLNNKRLILPNGVIMYITYDDIFTYFPETKQIKIAPLPADFWENLLKAEGYYSWSNPQPEKSDKIYIDQALEIVGKDPKKMLLIEARAVALAVATQEGNENDLTPPGKYAKDKLIFEHLAPGQEKSFNNIHAVLAWYEARFKMNPVLNEALKELDKGGCLINSIIKDKVVPDLFKGNIPPELPHDWQDVFVFAGGGNGLGGGRGYDHCPLLYGNYDEYRGDNPDDEKKILAGLVESGLHEAIHSFLQTASLLPLSQWDPENKPADPNYVLPEVRKGHLAHMAMCSLTAPAQEAYGFEPEIEPRIAYIYQVLKKSGVADPYGVIVEAAATFNSDRLWETYETVRGENISLDLLIETVDLAANSKINFSEDLIDNPLAEFKQDYRRYLFS